MVNCMEYSLEDIIRCMYAGSSDDGISPVVVYRWIEHKLNTEAANKFWAIIYPKPELDWVSPEILEAFEKFTDDAFRNNPN